MRTLLLMATVGLFVTGASAQESSSDPQAEIERLRADFRARFVDYDERLKTLARRIEELEQKLPDESQPTATSSVTLEPDDTPDP
ncbi:MAG: hypothetical protein AAGB11_13935 [Pseudomonadota bacterium]